MRKMNSMLAASGLAVLIAAQSGSAQAQAVMKLASATINDVQHEWLKRFDGALRARVGDKIKTEIYPASQLGAIPRMVEGVLLGTIEAFVTPTAFLVSTEPRFEMIDAPGVFDSPEHLNRVLGDDSFRRRVLALGESKGLKGIGIFYNSPVVVLSRKPIRNLADFRGQKIRVFATPLQIEPIKSLGGSPVPMPLSEVMAALQTGAIDGMLAGIPVLSPMKFYDAAKAVTEIHPAIVVSTLVVNKAWFDKLAPDLQSAIVESGARVDREALGFPSDLVARANKVWIDNGGQLIKLPPAEQAKMMADLKALAATVIGRNAAVKTEFDELVRVAERVK